MTDDVCGHPTEGGDGPPCELPASKSDGRCHHHTETDERANGGREWTIDESDHEEILTAAREGFSKAGCARAVGVDEKTLRRYVDAHDDFRRDFMRARHKGERTLLKGPLVEREGEPESIDGQHARFLLSTSLIIVVVGATIAPISPGFHRFAFSAVRMTPAAVLPAPTPEI